MKRLPKHITPARIRESIVQVFFESNIPVDPLVGYLFSVLGQEFGMMYSNKPLPIRKENLTENDLLTGIELQIGSKHFFYNNNIKVNLHPGGSLIFNCMDDYLGWTEFGSLIKQVIKSLLDKAIIINVHRIGVRYISEFANIDLLDKINFTFKLSPLEGNFNTGNFNIHWDAQPYQINLNLGTKLSIPPVLEHPEFEHIEHISLIDIDVIHKGFKINEYGVFDNLLDDTHEKEKAIFFSLLKADFLETLHPEY